MFPFGIVFPDFPRTFNTQYQCFSVSMMPGNERHDVERGGKIIMPPSALEQLTRLNISYPMLFKLTNKNKTRMTHSGVLEFVADEGRVYLPLWMMHNLLLEQGDSIQIECVSLPVATYSRFQPQSKDFLDISNPKAVLENGLRTFACLTSGDMIAIRYNEKIYELCVLETKPGNAVSIIECDMKVEFAAPTDYQEPERPRRNDEDINAELENMIPEPSGFVAFSGQGHRLDGKARKNTISSQPSTSTTYIRGIPNYGYEIGTLTFMRNTRPKIEDKKPEDEFKAFSGRSFSLRDTTTN